jgi:glycosyltransferase involved in cell wall biosynthesis
MVDHNVTGLIIPVGDINALASNLEKLLQDETYRTRLGANARKWVTEHWSMDLMTEQLIKHYEAAIEKRKTR